MTCHAIELSMRIRWFCTSTQLQKEIHLSKHYILIVFVRARVI